MAGIRIANKLTNQPCFLKAEKRLAVTIPISKRKMAKKPLKISVVNGRIPSACFSSATNPISKLPTIINTLPLVKE